MSLSTIMDPEWAQAMAPMEADIHAMGDFLRAENAAGHGYLPAGKNVLRTFSYPLSKVRVLIVGQDPYPTPGHPIGLSFAVERNVCSIPRSLSNIYRELYDDLGIPPASHGDLTPWCENGVMLLNRVLTVRPGAPASHRGKGWEKITDHAIRTLAQRNQPLVAILWGRQAQELAPLLRTTPTITSAHPSPLSATRGFFGSKPFSRVNALLIEQGAQPIDWRLE
ncbi:uracil-DNA glycosylase [Trueperella pyogenes]|uniref:uracil-DNA glycosylase n=1 Tax=Trueperella pyogenes TaxID=1661 RepID=UPI00345C784B